jgi:hypothetical protein
LLTTWTVVIMSQSVVIMSQFASLKNLTKRKRACESFVLKVGGN